MEKYIIEYKGQTIPIVIQRKNVKNINLRVRQDSSVVISAHNKVPYDFIEQFVNQKAPWIMQNIKRFDQNRHLYREEDYEDGDNIFYLGRPYRLKVQANAVHEDAFLLRGELHLLIKNEDDRARKKELLEEWYKKQAWVVFQDALERMLSLFSGSFKFGKPKLTVRTMKTRWGSCSWNRKRITLNTFLLRYPPECIDYVVLHELAHFIHQKHDHAFYDFLSGAMPDWKVRKKLLDKPVQVLR